MYQPRRLRLEENRFLGDGLGSLFHHPDYFRLHDANAGLYIEGFDGDRLVLVLHLSPEPNDSETWRSPLKGTYSAYAVSPELTLAAWTEAHDRIERRLIELGVRVAELLLAPMAHAQPHAAQQVYLLSSRGWCLARCDLNFAMDVDGREFRERLDADHRRRLRNALAAGVTAVRAAPSNLPAVYGLIAEGYRARGRNVSMSLDELTIMQEHFAHRLVLMACSKQGHMVGGTIALQLDPGVLYVYAWSSLPGQESENAVTVMAQSLYAFCQTNSIRLLDAGTATIGAQLDAGLAAFKRSLGFTESLKPRMTKTLVLTETVG